MTRAHVRQPVWAWHCDRCQTRRGLAYLQDELDSPDRMRELGWYIADVWGDLCPGCVAEGGVEEFAERTSRNTGGGE